MTPDRPQIELLLSTVNDVIVSAPMGLYQVAGKIWQKCLELSVISEMLRREIKTINVPRLAMETHVKTHLKKVNLKDLEAFSVTMITTVANTR